MSHIPSDLDKSLKVELIEKRSSLPMSSGNRGAVGSLGSVVVANGLTRLQNVFGADDFSFVLNGTRIATTAIEAILLSPAAADRLLSDLSVREFIVNDGSANDSTFQSLRGLFFGETPTFDFSTLKSMVSLCRRLGNTDLTNLLICVGFNEPGDSVRACLSDCGDLEPALEGIARDFGKYSEDQLSLFDMETLRRVLGSDSLMISSEDWLLETIISLGDEYSALLSQLHFEFLSLSGMRQFLDRYGYGSISEEIWLGLSYRLKAYFDADLQSRRFWPSEGGSELESKIVSELPPILNEFSDRSIRLLYRGSRDGFSSVKFHAQCDGIGSTLTLIETSRHNIFGGYTPCVWSSTGGDVFDESGRSFIFTLKNPHNLGARKFTLVKGKRAIYCHPGDGPTFGIGSDIRVLDGCNARADNSINMGHSYLNDTGIEGRVLLDPEYKYRVHEIEVFAISE
jgi:hypothetical protein